MHIAHSCFRCLTSFLICIVWTQCQAGEPQPNILLILADDMGYGDLGCLGSQKLKTPNIDALRKSGVLCSQAYVTSSVCSPSRAGLITGRDPRRFGYEGNLNATADHYATRPELLGLPPGEHTLGDHLRAAGYSTALVGKWHLGTGKGFHPNERGFDDFCGMLVGSHSYFPKPNKHRIESNGQAVTRFSSNYLTDFFSDQAVSWIQRQEKNDDERPWFLFLSYNAPHGPMHATDEDLALFKNIKDPKRQKYAAMMFAMDRGVGRVIQTLKDKGEYENTLICFFSDNGGATNNASWNGPLSGTKGNLREGGIRVPMIWSYPGKFPGNQLCQGIVSSLDLLPTFLAAAQSKPLPLSPPRSHEDQNNRKRYIAQYGSYDGINLLDSLAGKKEIPPRNLFFRLQGQKSVIRGNVKLISLAHRLPQLFHPGQDPGETNDLILKQRSKANELFERLGDWESMLPTVPLWGSSPFWSGQSAKGYDAFPVRGEPQ
ncbi:MAG: sulfatase-like hydrolase/transferase [Planctomycetota bacterium]|nr:sulfatase-like hydrolase/transferase [Planctomycetota bacterium]